MYRHDFLKRYLTNEPLKVETDKEARWMRWATEHQPLASPSIFTPTGRHLNHFCIGSDPEFCFRDEDENRIGAYDLGLKVGLAAGADQNERLVELRPWPSTSVVEHVAGILTAFRWMHRVYGHTLRRYRWRSGAFFSGDGMGGHVHFGRKRPTRTEEVAGLDGLARALRRTGIFPVREWDRRMRGDDHHNAPYGLPGDFRVQKHGYEYRSLPSWLQSPKVAFTVLTSSKLSVLDPSVTTKWEPTSVQQSRDLIRGLAKLYKSRDDDAYLLYHNLTKDGDAIFEVDYTGDFAGEWGINRDEVVAGEEDFILPACIKPHETEVEEIQQHLLFGLPLEFRKLKPNFVTTLPSTNYRWVPRHTAPNRRSGFGDLLHNLVTHQGYRIAWEYSNHNEFSIVGTIPSYWTGADTAFLKSYYPSVRIVNIGSGEGATTIAVPKCLCQTATLPGFKAVLLNSGLFPIWTVETVQENSIAHWILSKKETAKAKSWRVY